MEHRKITVKLLRHLLILHRCQYEIPCQILQYIVQYRLEQAKVKRLSSAVPPEVNEVSRKKISLSSLVNQGLIN